jgi:hypothetical protein
MSLTLLTGDMTQIVSEMRERRSLHRALLAEIDEELAAMHGALACDSGTPDANAGKVSATVQREVCGLLKERRLEKAAYWRDVSILRQELRQLTRECQEVGASWDGADRERVLI